VGIAREEPNENPQLLTPTEGEMMNKWDHFQLVCHQTWAAGNSPNEIQL